MPTNETQRARMHNAGRLVERLEHHLEHPADPERIVPAELDGDLPIRIGAAYFRGAHAALAWALDEGDPDELERAMLGYLGVATALDVLAQQDPGDAGPVGIAHP